MTDIEEKYEKICDKLDRKIDELVLKCRNLEEENRLLREQIEKITKPKYEFSWQL